MTMNGRNIKMKINIGGEPLQLNVPFERQDAVRDSETAVNRLYDEWRLKWRQRSDKEIMAMVAYQFASLYQDLLGRHDEAAELAAQCDKEISDLID